MVPNKNLLLNSEYLLLRLISFDKVLNIWKIPIFKTKVLIEKLGTNWKLDKE